MLRQLSNVDSRHNVTIFIYNLSQLVNSKSRMHVRNCEKNAEYNFSNQKISFFFNVCKIYSTESFLIFPVSSTMCNKKIFNKIWGLRLSFYERCK